MVNHVRTVCILLLSPDREIIRRKNGYISRSARGSTDTKWLQSTRNSFDLLQSSDRQTQQGTNSYAYSLANETIWRRLSQRRTLIFNIDSSTCSRILLHFEDDTCPINVMAGFFVRFFSVQRTCSVDIVEFLSYNANILYCKVDSLLDICPNGILPLFTITELPQCRQ